MMPPTQLPIRECAEVLARSLELGIVRVSDVIRWADAVIAASTEAPHWAVCEVATMSRAFSADVAHALRELPGPMDEQRVRVTMFTQIATFLDANPAYIEQLVELVLRAPAPVGDALERCAREADEALELRSLGMSNASKESIARAFAVGLRAAVQEDATRAT